MKHVVAFYHRQQTRVGYYRQPGNTEKEVDIVVDYPLGRLLMELNDPALEVQGFQ